MFCLHPYMALTTLLWALTAAAVWAACGSSLISLYREGDGDPVLRQLLSDHAFFVRRNRAVPPVMIQFESAADFDAAALRSAATSVRAVLLPEDESLLARFADAAGTRDPATRRRLFVGVIVRYSRKRFTAKRFLRILELLGTGYLDLVLVSGRPCGHTRADKLACKRNRLTSAFLHNWRNLLHLARKRRVLNLGLRHYPMTAVRELHAVSKPECLDSASACSSQLLRTAGGRNATSRDHGSTKKKTAGTASEKAKEAKQATDEKEQITKPKKKQKKLKKQNATQTSCMTKQPLDLRSAYSLRRAAGNVNFLTVVQATFNPRHRHRTLRRWCHCNSVVLLANEILGGPHEAEMLVDQRIASAAAQVKLPVRTAIMHWALKKRVGIAASPGEASEFAASAGALQGKSQHVRAIDATVNSDLETRYYLMHWRPSARHAPSFGILHYEL